MTNLAKLREHLEIEFIKNSTPEELNHHFNLMANKITRFENALTKITQDCTARKSVMIARNALNGKD